MDGRRGEVIDLMAILKESRTEEASCLPAFHLKLQPDHKYLKARGVNAELAKQFEVGYAARGMMAGLIAFAMRDETGEKLLGYVGWATDDAIAPRWKLTPNFPNGKVLWNFHRVRAAKLLVIVESPWGVLRLHTPGVPAVGLLGRTLSPHQEKLLVLHGVRRAMVMMDGDTRGREAKREIAGRLAARLWVRTVAPNRCAA